MARKLLNLAALGILLVVLFLVDNSGSTKVVQVFALFGIWGIATVSLNLINGVTGILSLGHHGFMLIGGYVTGLLMLPLAARENLAASSRSQLSDFAIGLSLEGFAQKLGLGFLAGPEGLWVLFLIALAIGGLVSALFGVVVGIPSLRLRGDYLAVVTFAFGEVIRLLASTPLMSPFTNGALGFAGVPTGFGKSVWWTFGLLAITIFVFARLKSGSYGRALQGIREDEVAAEAMGINISYHKVLAFAISAFFAGVAGGLWVSWVGTARLDLFLFTLTFYFLVAISAGGTGSITGALIGTALVVAVRQYGDPFEEAYALSTWLLVAAVILIVAAVLGYFYRRNKHLRPELHPALGALAIVGVVAAVLSLSGVGGEIFEQTWQGFGMRAIALSVLLVVIMVFRPAGVMGRKEANWSWLLRDRRDVPTDEERAQDAWLHTRGEGSGRPPQADGASGAARDASGDASNDAGNDTSDDAGRDRQDGEG